MAKIKVMLSQVMKNKTPLEVEKESDEMTNLIFDKYGEDNCTILSALYKEVMNKSDLESFIDSVNVIGMVDVVAMGYGWQSSRNCRLEHTIAQEYNIPIIYCTDLYTQHEELN